MISLSTSQLKKGLSRFLFASTSGWWISFLRIGLGIGCLLHIENVFSDWLPIFGNDQYFSRELTEATVSHGSIGIPHMGHLVDWLSGFNFSEASALLLIRNLYLIVSILFTVGFLTRPMAFAAFFFHLAVTKSMANMNYGADSITTAMLFVFLFAPLPDPLSLDAFFRRKKKLGLPVYTITLRRFLQGYLMTVYFFGGIAKFIGTHWWDGYNLWVAVHRPPFNALPASWLPNSQWIYLVAGISTVFGEILYPLLVVTKLRRFAVGFMISLHLGIAVCQNLYVFSGTMIMLNLVAFYRHPKSGKLADKARSLFHRTPQTSPLSSPEAV